MKGEAGEDGASGEPVSFQLVVLISNLEVVPTCSQLFQLLLHVLIEKGYALK